MLLWHLARVFSNPPHMVKYITSAASGASNLGRSSPTLLFSHLPPKKAVRRVRRGQPDGQTNFAHNLSASSGSLYSVPPMRISTLVVEGCGWSTCIYLEAQYLLIVVLIRDDRKDRPLSPGRRFLPQSPFPRHLGSPDAYYATGKRDGYAVHSDQKGARWC